MTLFRLDKYVDNLDTNINKLSTGEKQRIKIIRCILQDRPIWFLDEITSNIDKECEKIVLSVLRQIQIRKKKSVFHITHSVTSKNECDCVLSINNGIIVLS
jgi:ABC-type transport system involved in cytochrome bd biosynthesis fused ATPase/permease subunit